MFRRMARAMFRAFMMALLVATPSLALPYTAPDTAQVVLILAAAAALFTFFEYSAASPSFVEFRAAPPFNRIRYVALLCSLGFIAVVVRGGAEQSTITQLFTFLGDRVSHLLDFPYSPVRLMVLMLPKGADPALVETMRITAGIAYLISIVALIHFIVMMRVTAWPVRRKRFNFWVNLPTYDPTAGGDVVRRLGRDAQVNLILGFLLPFMVPAVIKLIADLGNPIAIGAPHTLIWTVAAWAFLPLSLLMRGIALLRVAQLISAQRERIGQENDARGLQAA